jgi:hypothetical protein
VEDGFDLDETSSEETEPEAPPASDPSAIAYWQKRAERAEKQAVERKVQLRRFEVAAEHGISAGDIPDYVPIDKMAEFASSFLKKTETPSATDQTEQPQAETPTETVGEASDAEKQLAAVAKGPGGASSPTGYSAEESLQMLKEIASSDPERAARLIDSGQLNLERLPGADR